MTTGRSWKPESQPASQPGTSPDQAGHGKRPPALTCLPAGKLLWNPPCPAPDL